MSLFPTEYSTYINVIAENSCILLPFLYCTWKTAGAYSKCHWMLRRKILIQSASAHTGLALFWSRKEKQFSNREPMCVHTCMRTWVFIYNEPFIIISLECALRTSHTVHVLNIDQPTRAYVYGLWSLLHIYIRYTALNQIEKMQFRHRK